MLKILIVDDDRELAALLHEYLTREGLKVECAHDGAAGLRRAQSGEHDLVVLDLMLPKLPGLDVLGELRRTSAIPVIILTARDDEVDRVLGLELGADDYMAKPFSSRELAARIRAVTRRVRHELRTEPRVIELEDLRLDQGARLVTRDGEDVPLTGTEFALLEQLVRSAGSIVSRDDLARGVLGRPAAGTDRSLDVHMSNLRRKLGPLPGGRERIKTIRSSGYVYVLPEEHAGDGRANARPRNRQGRDL